jgi:hypothetical protein
MDDPQQTHELQVRKIGKDSVRPARGAFYFRLHCPWIVQTIQEQAVRAVRKPSIYEGIAPAGMPQGSIVRFRIPLGLPM